MDLDDDGLAALEAGATYCVTWDDCCAAGAFTDVFVRLEYDDRETDFVVAVVFERSRITNFLRVEAERVGGGRKQLSDTEYVRAVQLCRDVVNAHDSDDGGPMVAGSFLGKLANLL